MRDDGGAVSRHAHAPLRGSRWRWLLVVWLLLSTTASAAKPPHEVRFVGADPSGRLCVRTSAGTLLRLSRHRRGLEGEVVGACARQLAPGPAPRTSVWLVSSKPKHRIPLTLDVSGSVVYNTITPDRVKMRRDRAYRQLIEALRRGGGRELVLLRGRHTVRLAQLHRGPVQFLRLRAQHEPKTSTTTLRLFVFFGRGMSVGPAQWTLAMLEREAKARRLVYERFVADHCLAGRCRTPPRRIP